LRLGIIELGLGRLDLALRDQQVGLGNAVIELGVLRRLGRNDLPGKERLPTLVSLRLLRNHGGVLAGSGLGNLDRGVRARHLRLGARRPLPRIILADEPTAALDSQRAQIVMDLLRCVAAEQRAAIITVTHDDKIFDRFDHIFQLRDVILENDPAPHNMAA
jgi:hypothetical protein